MHHYALGWWGFPFFPLIWVAVWLVIIFFIFGRFGHRRHWDRYNDSRKEMSAEEVLADRFAQGEIDEKEYENRLEVLKKHRGK
jgi:putative membrane protein